MATVGLWVASFLTITGRLTPRAPGFRLQLFTLSVCDFCLSLRLVSSRCSNWARFWGSRRTLADFHVHQKIRKVQLLPHPDTPLTSMNWICVFFFFNRTAIHCRWQEISIFRFVSASNLLARQRTPVTTPACGIASEAESLIFFLYWFRRPLLCVPLQQWTSVQLWPTATCASFLTLLLRVCLCWLWCFQFEYSLHLVADGQYGSPDPEWTGMVRELMDRVSPLRSVFRLCVLPPSRAPPTTPRKSRSLGYRFKFHFRTFSLKANTTRELFADDDMSVENALLWVVPDLFFHSSSRRGGFLDHVTSPLGKTRSCFLRPSIKDPNFLGTTSPLNGWQIFLGWNVTRCSDCVLLRRLSYSNQSYVHTF